MDFISRVSLSEFSGFSFFPTFCKRLNKPYREYSNFGLPQGYHNSLAMSYMFHKVEPSVSVHPRSHVYLSTLDWYAESKYCQ